jgi:hypothetical protein
MATIDERIEFALKKILVFDEGTESADIVTSDKHAKVDYFLSVDRDWRECRTDNSG